MYRKITVLIIFLGMFFMDGMLYAAVGPRISPLKRSWDFGSIKKGEIKEKTFIVNNIGDKKLTINNVHSCCGYATVNVSSWEIEPGERSEITISSDTSRKDPGIDSKNVTIISNDHNSPELKIPVTSRIVGSEEKEDVVYSSDKRDIVIDQINVQKEMPVDEVDIKEDIAVDEIAVRNKIVVDQISVKKVYKMVLKNTDIITVDVREENEFSEKHIPGAINFPRSVFADTGRIPLSLSPETIGNKVVAVYCGGGYRSSYMARKLKEHGLNAFNLDGGLKRWEKKGYYIIKGPKISSSMQPLEIEIEEAYEHYYLLFDDEVVWIDVRDAEEYKKGHIKGAVNMPTYLLQKNINSIPRDKNLVIYCEGAECSESTSFAKMLLENKYKKGMIRVFTGGYDQWKEEGYPVE